MNHWQRNIEQLREVASLFWPEELSGEAAKLSVIPILLNTQKQFLGILGINVSDIHKFFKLIELAELPANLFLKHLMILADFGGELLQRVNDNFSVLFPSGELEYMLNGVSQCYRFQKLPIKGRLTNDRLNASGRKLSVSHPLDDLSKDVIALLVFGSESGNPYTAEVLSKCEIGCYLGDPSALETFVRQRYIWVSRITAGSQTNNLGQLAQKYVQQYLEDHLDIPDIRIQAGGHMPGISHTDQNANRPTSFDLVVSKQKKYAAVEVSFQVTTNSVIERKAGQSQARYQQIQKAGYKMAYVLDGAGNFQRENAVSTICAHSHCTVAFSRSELKILCDFLREYFA